MLGLLCYLMEVPIRGSAYLCPRKVLDIELAHAKAFFYLEDLNLGVLID